MKIDNSLLIDGKPIDDWNQAWVKVPGGLRQKQDQLRDQIGLYRITLRGVIGAIGLGTDKRSGLAKRLSDFNRIGESGRNYHAGRLIYAHRNRVEVEVLITGDRHSSPDAAKQLKTLMIEMHNPIWTAPYRSPRAFKWSRKRKFRRAGSEITTVPYIGTIPASAGPSAVHGDPC